MPSNPKHVPDRQDDRVLVQAVLAGDMGAFDSLYRAHVRTVVVVIRDRVYDPESVADIVQEVFARALERLGELRDHDRFGPWLTSIARHAAADHRRSRCRSPMSLLGHDTESPAPGPGPDVLAELNELADLVRTCVAGLSPRDATALTLVTQLGLAAADIAACLGVSVGTANVILHRARRRLGQALVLEVLVRRRAGGCEEFDLLFEIDDLVTVGRHVRSCARCGALGESEIALYASTEVLASV